MLYISLQRLIPRVTANLVSMPPSSASTRRQFYALVMRRRDTLGCPRRCSREVAAAAAVCVNLIVPMRVIVGIRASSSMTASLPFSVRVTNLRNWSPMSWFTPPAEVEVSVAVQSTASADFTRRRVPLTSPATTTAYAPCDRSNDDPLQASEPVTT
jgi:hypothetical protein